MAGFDGCGTIGPVSQPGPSRHSSGAKGFAWLEIITVEASCCAP
jgi:hypothetical protein